MSDGTACPICGMEFEDEGDLGVHLLDCEAAQLEELDGP